MFSRLKKLFINLAYKQAYKIGVILVFIPCLISCGLTQTIKAGSSELTQSLFYKKIKTLRLDMIPRSDINQDDQQHALSLVLRIYQLKDRQLFDQSDYLTLLSNDSEILAQDLLARRELTVRPNANAAVTQRMEDATKYVAIVGLFRTPDLQFDTWRLLIERSALDADRATEIEIEDNRLGLLNQPIENSG